jgi:hypothetical protein
VNRDEVEEKGGCEPFHATLIEYDAHLMGWWFNHVQNSYDPYPPEGRQFFSDIDLRYLDDFGERVVERLKADHAYWNRGIDADFDEDAERRRLQPV